jgi:hypothetical protein
VPDRQVRFTEQFFERLDLLLPGERGADGTPSVTDFLLLDLPRVRDRLAGDYEGNTLPTDDPNVRVYVGAGVLVSRFAIFVALEADAIEAHVVRAPSRPDMWLCRNHQAHTRRELFGHLPGQESAHTSGGTLPRDNDLDASQTRRRSALVKP